MSRAGDSAPQQCGDAVRHDVGRRRAVGVRGPRGGAPLMRAARDAHARAAAGAKSGQLRPAVATVVCGTAPAAWRQAARRRRQACVPLAVVNSPAQAPRALQSAVPPPARRPPPAAPAAGDHPPPFPPIPLQRPRGARAHSHGPLTWGAAPAARGQSRPPPSSAARRARMGALMADTKRKEKKKQDTRGGAEAWHAAGGSSPPYCTRGQPPPGVPPPPRPRLPTGGPVSQRLLWHTLGRAGSVAGGPSIPVDPAGRAGGGGASLGGLVSADDQGCPNCWRPRGSVPRVRSRKRRRRGGPPTRWGPCGRRAPQEGGGPFGRRARRRPPGASTGGGGAGTASRPHRLSGSGGRCQSGTAPRQWHVSTQPVPPPKGAPTAPTVSSGDGRQGALTQGARVGVGTHRPGTSRGTARPAGHERGVGAPRRPSAAPIKTPQVIPSPLTGRGARGRRPRRPMSVGQAISGSLRARKDGSAVRTRWTGGPDWAHAGMSLAGRRRRH